MEVCTSPIPDFVLLPPLLILDLSVYFPALLTFFQKLEGFQSLFVMSACSVCVLHGDPPVHLSCLFGLHPPLLSPLKLSVFVLSPTSYRMFVSNNCGNESFDSPTGSDDEVDEAINWSWIICLMLYATGSIWSSKDRACVPLCSFSDDADAVIVFHQLAGLHSSNLKVVNLNAIFPPYSGLTHYPYFRSAVTVLFR